MSYIAEKGKTSVPSRRSLTARFAIRIFEGDDLRAELTLTAITTVMFPAMIHVIMTINTVIRTRFTAVELSLYGKSLSGEVVLTDMVDLSRAASG